jgi:hypothetical protein
MQTNNRRNNVDIKSASMKDYCKWITIVVATKANCSFRLMFLGGGEPPSPYFT